LRVERRFLGVEAQLNEKSIFVPAAKIWASFLDGLQPSALNFQRPPAWNVNPLEADRCLWESIGGFTKILGNSG